MKVKNWELIEESAVGEKLPAGGYVVRIVDVNDVPEKEYLWIVYDILESNVDGKLSTDHAGHYGDDFGKQNPWAHRFTRSYKDSAEGMFKAFLSRLEESNRGKFDAKAWQGKSDEREFVGLELGVVLQTRYYTNEKGEDKEALEVRGVYASQDIRSGDFKVPAPNDKREKAPAAGFFDDVPFGSPSWA